MSAPPARLWGWHVPTPFGTQYLGFLDGMQYGKDGMQYGKGRYAVRKNPVTLYADIFFFFKKVQFSSRNTTNMIYKVK